jgi:predicted dehydrogenase
MDIGCYPIKTSRMVFGEEPVRVSGRMERDAALTGVDVLTSAILEFPSGSCIFTCSMQLAAHQMMRFHGTKGFIVPEIPFNAVPGGTSRITIDDGRDLSGGGAVVEEFAACDHYTLQGDRFSRAVLEGGPPPVPLEDSLRNMAVIDAIVRSSETGAWVRPAEFL